MRDAPTRLAPQDGGRALPADPSPAHAPSVGPPALSGYRVTPEVAGRARAGGAPTFVISCGRERERGAVEPPVSARGGGGGGESGGAGRGRGPSLCPPLPPGGSAWGGGGGGGNNDSGRRPGRRAGPRAHGRPRAGGGRRPRARAGAGLFVAAVRTRRPLAGARRAPGLTSLPWGRRALPPAVSELPTPPHPTPRPALIAGPAAARAPAVRLEDPVACVRACWR